MYYVVLFVSVFLFFVTAVIYVSVLEKGSLFWNSLEYTQHTDLALALGFSSLNLLNLYNLVVLKLCLKKT